MVKIVITHTVKDMGLWKSKEAERQENIGKFASEITSFIDPEAGTAVAVSMTVHDMDGLMRFIGSKFGQKLMDEHGVVQPVCMMVHPASL